MHRLVLEPDSLAIVMSLWACMVVYKRIVSLIDEYHASK